MEEIEKKGGKQHVKQIGLKCFPDDMKRIETIKKKHGLKGESDALRMALMLEDENNQLHEILLSHKQEIQRLNEELKNVAWRQNANYQLSLKIAKHLGIVGE
ncbi:hypothetical protein [Burkholderia contaminans]|uniref:hypothetical protein n=1 Tax=Burkholderia contaminans TaxID=488447 RepID=UPI00158A7C62|nr:hypothetical protein [Burkholderia contaminans]